MKTKAILFLAILSLTTIIATNPLDVDLEAGKNNISVLEYFPAIPVSTLIAAHPEIESISVNEYGQTFVYINTFGGIGTDFLFQPEKEYEVHVSKQTKLFLND